MSVQVLPARSDAALTSRMPVVAAHSQTNRRNPYFFIDVRPFYLRDAQIGKYAAPEPAQLVNGQPVGGFRFDGTSMPVGLRWLISPSDSTLLAAAGYHDDVFRHGRFMVVHAAGESPEEVPATWQEANRLMAKAMKVFGVSGWKRLAINAGLATARGIVWRRLRDKYGN